MRCSSYSQFGAWALASALVVASPAAAERQAWDQATVASIAADLATAVRALENTLRKEPHLANAARTGDRDTIGFWEAIDALEKASRQLAGRTRDGKGYKETLPIARKIRTLVHDAQQFGARLMTSAFMEEKIAPVEALLGRLAPYYF